MTRNLSTVFYHAIAMMLLIAYMTSARANELTRPPNILWILVEDMSPDMHCYGNHRIETPNIDTLASRGVRFDRAFTTGPICSISRSALLTGNYQTTIGCHNHRSSSTRFPIRLPAHILPVTQLLKSSGYHTNNLTLADFLSDNLDQVSIAKKDYNFVWDPQSNYDSQHWMKRKRDKPFFVQIQLQGGKFRGQKPSDAWPRRVLKETGLNVDRKDFDLPPYLPEDPVIREDWAQYLDAVRYTDYEVGLIMKKLESNHLLDSTVIIFWTDHGISHIRNKQFLYEGGIRVPLILSGPGIPVGCVRTDLVEHIDIAATTLELAGVSIPDSVEGKSLNSNNESPRTFVFGARDRADETVDRIRSVRSDKYKYIRNFFPNRPYLQPNRYKDDKAIVQVMRSLYAQGLLNQEQSQIMAESRPVEEFYDLESDPYELHNLASVEALQTELNRHREALERWIKSTGDQGVTSEPAEMYLSNVFDDRPEGGKNQLNDVFEQNVQLMLRWAAERPMILDL